MAPNFLQKFVKSSTTSTNSSNNTPRERVSSDVYSSLRSPSETGSSSSQAHSSGSGSGTTSPGGRARAATIQTASGSSSSLTSPTTPTQASVILKGVQQQQQQAQSGRRSPSRRSSTNNSSDKERETSRIPSIITTLSGRSRSKGSKDKEKEKEKKKKSDKEKNANANRDSLTVQNHHTPLSAGDRTSWGSAYSSQPNFTIVPPSPLVRNGDLYSSDSDAYDNENDNDAATTHSNTNTNTNFNGASPNTAEDQDSAATPTLPSFSGSASQSGASKNIHATPSNSTSSTSSTPNTSSSFTNNSSHTSSSNTNTSNTSDHDASDHDMSNLAPGAYQVRKKPSNRSIKNGAAPPEINVAAAAATLGGAPQAVNGSTANGSSEGAGGEEPVNGAVTQRPIVESPTDLKFPAPASSGSGMTASTSTSTTASSANSNLGAPSSSTTLQRENTTSSLFSPDATTKSKRPWKRSTTRKPTGLASAIAASGLAMANPSLSAAQSAQMPVVPVPPPALSAGSSKDKDSNDPYLSRSPAQSAVSTGKGRHTKSRSGETSPRSSKSRKSSMGSPPRSGTGRSRRASSAKSTDEFGTLHPSSSNRANGGNDDTGSNISRRPSFYKSLISHSSSGSSDSDSDSGSVDSSDLDIGEEDIPVTGFAVASNKRNADFHELFPGVPEGDYLIEDYGCALQREILIQGRIYISENHICFHANIFGWITDGDGGHDAVQVSASSSFTLVSSSSGSLLTSAVAPDANCSISSSLDTSSSSKTNADSSSPSPPTPTTSLFAYLTHQLSIPIYEITSLEKKMTAFVIPNGIQITTRQAKYTFASFLSRDTTFDVIYNIWRLARPEDNVSYLSSGRGSGSVEANQGAVGRKAMDGAPSTNASGGAPAAAAAAAPSALTGVPQRKATQCTCGKENKHYSEMAMDVTFPGTPEKINSLMFTSGFIKDFMVGNQKLLDIQMSDWSPVVPGSKLLTRNFSYIKPLNGSLGPKQTKCELKDEMVYCDYDNYVSTVTTTRTPDVPSGGVFSVKTRTCVTWAGPISTRVLVTTQVEWTGRSFIKGIIERSAIDGQKVYHAELEKCMRSYIQEHKSEFLPEGIDASAVTPAEAAPAPSAPDATTAAAESPSEKPSPTQDELKQRERERNARGLQWAWDTFDGAWQVALRSTKGALELIRDAWDQSSSTTILWFVIVVLVLSNIWTLMRMGSGRAQADRKIEVRKVEEREKWVQSIVTALWDELNEKAAEAGKPGLPYRHGHGQPVRPVASEQVPLETIPTASVLPYPEDDLEARRVRKAHLELEVQQLYQSLEALEQRVRSIKQTLANDLVIDQLD